MKKLCLYTINFPYGNSETFLESEVEILSKQFNEVHIFPIDCSGEKRKLPKNIKVHNVFVNVSPDANHSKVLLSNFFKVIGLFFKEFVKGRVQKKYIVKLHYILAFFIRAKAIKTYLVEKNLIDSIHYTYWFDMWSTCLSIANVKYITRAHGFDLFEERSKNGFIPFRDLQLKKVHEVYSVSKAGQLYLKDKYPRFKEKIKVSYLGTSDCGVFSLEKKNDVVMVSCSNVIQLKRLDKIVDSLCLLKRELKWVHFGDGPLLESVKELSKKIPSNVKVSFLGRKTNREVLEYYKSNSVDLFINVSESEGLPVSIMEAISFGVPVVGTDVGGTSEIVGAQTGVLIEKDFTSKELVEIFENKIDEMKSDEFRLGVRKFWENNFNAKENYIKFTTELLKQK